MKHSVWFFIVAMLVLSACAPITPAAQPAAAMPNPASVFCADNGGAVDIRKDAQGGEYGMCVFADGSECDEWAFFRGECKAGESGEVMNMRNPASVFCAEKGGTVDIRDEAEGSVGYCVFAGKSECEEWAFFRGECKPGDAPAKP